MGLRVVCGRAEVIETFWPTSRLTSVDLPTLGRPTTAIKPLRKPLSVAPTWDSSLIDARARRRGAVSPRTGSDGGRLLLRPRPPCRRTRVAPGGRLHRESTA